MSLFIDLSEFLTHPITTGIQRITGEMCKYLPPNVLTPVRLRDSGYVAYSPTLLSKIAEYFRQGSETGAAEILRLGDPGNGSPIDVTPQDTVLVPEVFDNPQRLAYFRDMSEEDLARYRFIVFDMLPLTHPQYFWADKVGIYEYFKLLRRASNCGFISEESRQVYYRRMKRMEPNGGVVLPLGADSLGARSPKPILNRPLNFSVLGTVEPRKNHQLVLEAFEPLLREIKGLNLCFVGRMGWVNAHFSERVHALESDKDSGFRFLAAPGDEAIREVIQGSRATIYASAAEGYGLPPVESLWAGTPVIASKMIPSLNELNSPDGIHFVEPLTVVNIRRAVLAFLDDDYANRKTEQAATRDLPTWELFTREVLRWCATIQIPNRARLKQPADNHSHTYHD